MSEVLTGEFAFVEDIPKRQRSRLRRLIDAYREVKAITDEKGMLLPVKLAADMAGVCHQRIAQLADAGQLEIVRLHGHRYVTESSFFGWVNSERKTGRPPKLATMSYTDSVKMAWSHRKDTLVPEKE